MSLRQRKKIKVVCLHTAWTSCLRSPFRTEQTLDGSSTYLSFAVPCLRHHEHYTILIFILISELNLSLEISCSLIPCESWSGCEKLASKKDCFWWLLCGGFVPSRAKCCMLLGLPSWMFEFVKLEVSLGKKKACFIVLNLEETITKITVKEANNYKLNRQNSN